MAADRGRPLPKFGEWDVNNPASADGFTVIFSKARDERKSSSSGTGPTPPQRNNSSSSQKKNDKAKSPANKKSWLCCGA